MTDDGRRTDPGLEVAPTRVGSQRTTGPLVVIVVAVLFVAAALVKPWDLGRPAASASPRTVPASIASSAAPATDGKPGPVDGTSQQPTAEAIVAAATRRAEWGVRSIVVRPGSRTAGGGLAAGIAERWSAIPVSPVGGVQVGPPAPVGESGDAVFAIGVTTTIDDLALDLRFWRIEANGRIRRILPQPIPGPEAGSLLWLADPREATATGAWAAGRYRIDVLLAGRIVWVEATVADGTPRVPRTEAAAAEPPDLTGSLATGGPGVFAFTPSLLLPVEVSVQPLLDELPAWLGRAGGVGGGSVGQVIGDPISGLAIVLPAGERIGSVMLTRIVPTLEWPAVRTTVLPEITTIGGHLGGVLVEPMDRSAIETGLYHLEAEIVEATATRLHDTWNLDIAPSPLPTPPHNVLDRLARWIPLTSTPDRVAGEPIITELDRGVADGDGTCGGSARITTADDLIGLAEPSGTLVSRIRLFPTTVPRAGDVRTVIARNVGDGLTVIALDRGSLAATQYDLFADVTSPQGSERVGYTVCVR